MNTLKAEKRDMSIKAKKLRREGYVTGNLFGREINGSIPVKIEKSAAEKLLKTSNKGSQILLELEGTSYDVLIKEVQYNSMKGQIEEIDFQALVKGEKVHAVTEIFLLNHEKVNTGVVQQLLHEIAYKADPAHLLDKIEVDVGDMKAGDILKVKDLPIARDTNISLQTDPEADVVTVTEVHTAPDEAASEEEA
ncbi:MAG TPA: 50S ribosomal protein L25 [Candidatus Scatomonas pullistercoris]|uniref:50S ribosomal protein L25 n=1 Tax=Candidatus Scatomonas pullistercoris TaxID=2840920 RepID=A0A9D1T9I6_9FIRM|nr:50S ribosomal protein L25 [Candidatus Scatomonas pullistercoris]